MSVGVVTFYLAEVMFLTPQRGQCLDVEAVVEENSCFTQIAVQTLLVSVKKCYYDR